MMTEQQMTLKSDDLQERWKSCVRVTCYVYRTVEWVKDFYERVLDAISLFIENMKTAFRDFTESLADAFKDLADTAFNSEDNKFYQSYPQSYTHYVDNLRVNTKGFPRPVTHCARSRC